MRFFAFLHVFPFCHNFLAPQNDRLNLTFVKAIYAVAGKMARNVRKMLIYETQILDKSLIEYSNVRSFKL